MALLWIASSSPGCEGISIGMKVSLHSNQASCIPGLEPVDNSGRSRLSVDN
jgi:hypothetical protein